jgi:hypothetical protein
MLLEFKAYPPTLLAFASLVFVDALICVLRDSSFSDNHKKEFLLWNPTVLFISFHIQLNNIQNTNWMIFITSDIKNKPYYAIRVKLGLYQIKHLAITSYP